jgi:two-component system, OmpR family, KDP operon response regulator KdpE
VTNHLVAPTSGSHSPSSASPALILLVEDDPGQRAVLSAALSARGHVVEQAASGARALDLAKVIRPDLILLDLGLPDMDGLELCRHLRLQLSCPVIVVTADGVEDRAIALLDLGADDYVLKPYRMNELLARVRVALRHRLVTTTMLDAQILECGDVIVDIDARQVVIAGAPVEVYSRQFDLLVALVRNEGRVVTYSILARALWGLDAPENYQYPLRTAISKLRRVLGVGPRRPMIDTEHHVGYRLVVANPDAE